MDPTIIIGLVVGVSLITQAIGLEASVSYFFKPDAILILGDKTIDFINELFTFKIYFNLNVT